MLEISILEIQINFLDDEPTILIIFYIKTLKHSFSLLVQSCTKDFHWALEGRFGRGAGVELELLKLNHSQHHFCIACACV